MVSFNFVAVGLLWVFGRDGYLLFLGSFSVSRGVGLGYSLSGWGCGLAR
jgi:hypothetical protein